MTLDPNTSLPNTSLPSVTVPSTIPASTVSSATSANTQSLADTYQSYRNQSGLPELQSKQNELLNTILQGNNQITDLSSALRSGIISEEGKPQQTTVVTGLRENQMQQDVQRRVQAIQSALQPLVTTYQLNGDTIKNIQSALEFQVGLESKDKENQFRRAELDQKTAEAANMEELNILKTLADIPEGQTVTLGGRKFKGLKQLSPEVQIVERDDGSVIMVNKVTGKVTDVSGAIAKPDFQPVVVTSEDMYGNKSQSVLTFDKTTGKVIGSARGGSTGGTNGGINIQAPAAINDAFTRAVSDSGLSAPDRKALFQAYQNYVKGGDYQNATELILNSVAQSAGQSLYQQYLGRTKTLKQLGVISTELQKFASAGGDTNIFTGTLEDIAKKVGTVKDAKLREIATRINGALFEYRQSFTGAQFSEKEAAAYEKLFPTISGTISLNSATLRGLVGQISTSQESFLESRLGPKNYSALTQFMKLSQVPVNQTVQIGGKTYRRTSAPIEDQNAFEQVDTTKYGPGY